MRELLVCRFDGLSSSPEGQVLGALERIGGRAIAVEEVLVAAREPDTGELSALHVRPRGGDGQLIADFTDFRLDPRRRRAISKRVLAADPRLAELAATLAPGSGVIVLVVRHRWLETLGEGVARAGGRLETRRALDGDVELADAALAATR